MKKSKSDELRPEYRKEDLGKGVRGKHLKAYQTGTNLVLLDAKVAMAFPTERAVNEALNGLIEVAEHVGLVRGGVQDEQQQYAVKQPRRSAKGAAKRNTE